MGILDAFTGRAQARDIDKAYGAAKGYLTQGYDDAAGIGRQYYGDAQGYLKPWAEQGGRANALYGRYLGLDGADAQREAMGSYSGDPFRQFNQDQATRQVQRQYNARGMDTSGNALLAAARASQERGSQDYNAYLDRLRGEAGQGAQFANAQAGMASNFGTTLMGMRYGQGQQLAGNEINAGNARAATRGIGWQNLIGIGGAAANAYAGWNRR